MSCGIGGDLFVLYWDAKTKTLHGLNGSGRAPEAISPDIFASRQLTAIPMDGPLTWTVPGCVDGWEELRSRFGFESNVPMILAASTHAPEEQILVETIQKIRNKQPVRLMLAPRHPERFNEVASLLQKSGLTWTRRTNRPDPNDANATVILLDTIGELRAAYPLAEIVFVGGSLIPHGGQSVLEPAAAGKAIMTGPYTSNFDAVVNEFLDRQALRQLPAAADHEQICERLHEEFAALLEDKPTRDELARNALSLMQVSRDATRTTIELLLGRIKPPT